MIHGLFTAHVFSGFGRLSPEGVIMSGGAVDERVSVCKASGDPIVGVELLDAECSLVLFLPSLKSSGSGHTLLVSCRVH